MKLVYSKKIDDLRGCCETVIDGQTYVFTDTTPCYMNDDAVVIKDCGDSVVNIVKSEKRKNYDREFIERLIEINKHYPPIKSFQ